MVFSVYDQRFQELLGKDEYDKVLGRVNAELPDSQKVLRPDFCNLIHMIMPWKTIPDKGALLHFASQVNLLSPVAGLHVALTANKDEERR